MTLLSPSQGQVIDLATPPDGVDSVGGGTFRPPRTLDVLFSAKGLPEGSVARLMINDDPQLVEGSVMGVTECTNGTHTAALAVLDSKGALQYLQPHSVSFTVLQLRTPCDEPGLGDGREAALHVPELMANRTDGVLWEPSGQSCKRPDPMTGSYLVATKSIVRSQPGESAYIITPWNVRRLEYSCRELAFNAPGRSEVNALKPVLVVFDANGTLLASDARFARACSDPGDDSYLAIFLQPRSECHVMSSGTVYEIRASATGARGFAGGGVEIL